MPPLLRYKDSQEQKNLGGLKDWRLGTSKVELCRHLLVCVELHAHAREEFPDQPMARHGLQL